MPPTNYAVRLRRPYESLRQSISSWALECSKVVAYEHPEDGNIHCHLLLMGYYGSKQHLKDVLSGHGQMFTPDQWSFKEKFKAPNINIGITINEETAPGFITYMSKGKYEPKYLKGYSAELCEAQKNKWVNYNETKPPALLAVGDRKVCDEFEDYMWNLKCNTNTTIKDPKEIRDLAFSWSIARHQGVVNMQSRKMAKMLADTYCLAWKYVDVSQLSLPFEELRK